MTYLIKNARGEILSFGETSSQPTEMGHEVDYIDTPFHEYAQRLVLSVNGVAGQTCHAWQCGPDIKVEVATTLKVRHINLDVNGTIMSVPLKEGKGCLMLTPAQPGVFVVKPAQPRLYCAAGTGTLVIEIIPNA